MKNKLIYIAHPVGGNIKENIKKILQICHNIHRENNGVIPFAPYIVALYYLNDDIIEERKLGMLANQEHFKRKTMDEIWLYGDNISKGMEGEIKLAIKHEIPIKLHNPKLKNQFELITKNLK